METQVESEKALSFSDKFRQLFENKNIKRAAIFSHTYPDPDALGSQMAIKWLLEKFNITSDMYISGKIAHPQNMTMVNLLGLELHPLDNYVSEEYGLNFVVDATPMNAGVNGHKINFDCVIDHHKIILEPNYKGLYINTKAGSCCAQIYDLLHSMGTKFDDDVDYDCKVATALMVGITTDTENLMSDDATDYEFKAWSDLFQYRDPICLKQIVRYQRPKFWTDTKIEAMKHPTIDNRIGVVGLGIIPSKHRDVVADVADELATWEDIKTAVAFALIDGKTVVGSVRSDDTTASVNEICSALGSTKKGSGGGKPGKGAYSYELGGASIDDVDDEDDQKATWELINQRERKRVLRILNS